MSIHLLLRRLRSVISKSRLVISIVIALMTSNHVPDTITGMMACRTQICVIQKIWTALSCVIHGLISTVGLKQMDHLAGMCTPRARHGMELKRVEKERNIVLA
jgi:hypothetical protein